jgi:hypothetical protein
MSETIFPKCTKSKINLANEWVLNWSFLKSIKSDCDIYEGCISLEQIESVLLSPTVGKEIKKHYEKLEQENKIMRECIEFVIANSGTSTNYNLKCRETLNKLTKDER